MARVRRHDPPAQTAVRDGERLVAVVTWPHRGGVVVEVMEHAERVQSANGDRERVAARVAELSGMDHETAYTLVFSK